MYIFKKIEALQHFLSQCSSQGKSIGFVPTMGALHKGHISLIALSKAQSDITVCSIFVNPTQFNEKEDFNKYPRTLETDIALLEMNGCDVLFLPDVEEIYPDPQEPAPQFDFGYLDKPMEGAHRPGHFSGVAQVVNRLLQIVQPTHLFMGQKDYQQYKIIDKMLQLTNSKVQLHMCPTLREDSGLAMSSRNMRLSEEEKQQAAYIYQALRQVEQMSQKLMPVDLVKREAVSFIQKHIQNADVEYLEIADADTLAPILHIAEHQKLVVCTAVRVGNVRLIDNLLMNTFIQ